MLTQTRDLLTYTRTYACTNVPACSTCEYACMECTWDSVYTYAAHVCTYVYIQL